jgi:hypothetical protein
VADNRARNLAGGLLILNLNGGPTRIAYSTLSGNSAGNAGGAFGLDADSNATIENSTISGNTSPWISVGVMHPGMTIANSTIAFNRTYAQFDCLGAIIVSEEAHIESSILAGNTCNDAPAWDISGSGGSESSDIVGADNLIQSAGVTSMPGDTITGVDPLLAPLADNGGRTLTHMPASNSLAIGRGNNVLGFELDQRGEGFPRTKGACTDIGAVER